MAITQITKVEYSRQSPLAIIAHTILMIGTLGGWLIPWLIIRVITRRATHTVHDVSDASPKAVAAIKRRPSGEWNIVHGLVAAVLIGGTAIAILAKSH